MEPLINDLIAKLTEFKTHSADLAAIQATHRKTESELVSMKTSVEAAKEELASTQTGLTAIQVKNRKQYEKDIFDRHKELESLNTAITTARSSLDTLNVEIESASAKHQQIEASIESLRKKLG